VFKIRNKRTFEKKFDTSNIAILSYYYLVFTKLLVKVINEI
jgi:hypothetical protein